MSYVVRLSDTEQGYADDEVYGTFRTREAAQAFANRVTRHVLDDNVEVTVDRVASPLLRTVRGNGWLTAAEWRWGAP